MLSFARWGLAAAFVAFLAVNAAAQRREGGEGQDKGQSEAPSQASEGAAREAVNCFEFAFGDGLSVGYRNAFHRGKGYMAVDFLAGGDDDYALSGRLMRFGEPSAETPIGLGIGIGLLGATIDDPDSDVLAITLTGAIDYELSLTYPTRVGIEASYAPAVSSFSDAEEVLDVLARVELDLSTWATAFVGYRHFEVDLDEDGEHELDSALQGGVRLGF